MRTRFTKGQKTTEIFFDETKSRITGYTHSTDLKTRLTTFAEPYSGRCTMTDEDIETVIRRLKLKRDGCHFV